MEVNRREYGLVGLRIGSAGTTDRVGFRLDLPDGVADAAPGPPEGPDVPTAQLGLPARMPRGDLPDRSYQLPDAVLRWLDQHDLFAWVDHLTGTGLWLHVRNDHPLLRMVAWERLFADAGVTVPVLRLPGYLARPPMVPRKQPRIALWLTMPAAKIAYSTEFVVERMLDAWRRLPIPPQLHVFTDQEQVARLSGMLDAAGADAVVHEPPDRTATTSDDGHPWLTWIERALHHTRIDVLHLVGHGYLSGDHPGFATAQDPTSNEDRNWARFVWPNEIAGTMTRIGAASAVVTAVPGNYSAGALRLLTTRLASLRSGPAVFDDMEAPDAVGLQDAYRLLLAHPTPLPSSTRHLAITAHPAHFGIEMARDVAEAGHTVTLLEEAAVGGGHDAPAWAASAHSQLKGWEAQLEASADGPRVAALRAGLELTKQRLDALLTEGTVVADGDEGSGTEVEA